MYLKPQKLMLHVKCNNGTQRTQTVTPRFFSLAYSNYLSHIGWFIAFFSAGGNKKKFGEVSIHVYKNGLLFCFHL